MPANPGIPCTPGPGTKTDIARCDVTIPGLTDTGQPGVYFEDLCSPPIMQLAL